MTRVIFSGWAAAMPHGPTPVAASGSIPETQENSKRLAAGQCDINTGTGIDLRMLRVTPPRMNSRNREWP